MRFEHFVGIVLCVTLPPAHLWSQTAPNVEQGLKPYGAFKGGEIDFVSMTNGNVVVQVPLVSYPQRGTKLKMNFPISYSNKGWFIKTLNNGSQVWSRAESASVRIVREQSPSLKQTDKTIRQDIHCPDCVEPVYLVDVVTHDGSVHQLGSHHQSGSETLDGSGFRGIGTRGLGGR